MKRAGGLFPHINSFENLLTAAHNAAKGKRFQPQIARFNLNLEGNLLDIQQELHDGTYSPGPYTTLTL